MAEGTEVIEGAPSGEVLDNTAADTGIEPESSAAVATAEESSAESGTQAPSTPAADADDQGFQMPEKTRKEFDRLWKTVQKIQGHTPSDGDGRAAAPATSRTPAAAPQPMADDDLLRGVPKDADGDYYVRGRPMSREDALETVQRDRQLIEMQARQERLEQRLDQRERASDEERALGEMRKTFDNTVSEARKTFLPGLDDSQGTDADHIASTLAQTYVDDALARGAEPTAELITEGINQAIKALRGITGAAAGAQLGRNDAARTTKSIKPTGGPATPAVPTMGELQGKDRKGAYQSASARFFARLRGGGGG